MLKGVNHVYLPSHMLWTNQIATSLIPDPSQAKPRRNYKKSETKITAPFIVAVAKRFQPQPTALIPVFLKTLQVTYLIPIISSSPELLLVFSRSPTTTPVGDLWSMHRLTKLYRFRVLRREGYHEVWRRGVGGSGRFSCVRGSSPCFDFLVSCFPKVAKAMQP